MLVFIHIIASCCFLNALAASVVWNITTDPMPPLQPKEMGCDTQNYQHYYLIPSGEVILDLNVPGYQFNSYSQQCIMSITGKNKKHIIHVYYGVI